MATKFYTVGNNGNHGNQVGLDCLCTMAAKLFTVGQKRPTGVACFRYKGYVDIFWITARFSWNLVGMWDDAVQGDLNAIIFNPVASTILI
jgi:hypothetical protein